MISKLRNWPFEALAGTGYLIGNGILAFQSVIEGTPLIPSTDKLQTLDPSSWQSLAGLLWIMVALSTYVIKKYPNGTVKFMAFLNLLANSSLLISGYTQEAFTAHAIGLIPAFIAVALMFQGNKLKEKGGFYARYPVACAAGLFILAVPPLLYNSILSQDWLLTGVICLWFISHIFFAFTDLNFKRKVFGTAN